MSVTRFNKKVSYAVLAFMLLATLVASAALPYAVHAAPSCFVDANAAGPVHDGSSWSAAYTSLQEALLSPTCTEIWVADGIYTPDPADETISFVIPNGVAVYGGFAGTESGLDQRVLHLEDGDFNNDSVLSGEIGENILTDNSQHVVRITNNSNVASRVDGFVIQDGYADGTTTTNSREGAGMNAQNAYATLANLYFRNNYAQDKGGGISAANTHLVVQNIVFESNTGGLGGGLHDYEAANTYTNLTFFNNDGGSGGGAYLYASTSTITGAFFDGNAATADDGGALSVNTGSPVISNSAFTNNTAVSTNTAHGGAIIVGTSSTPVFADVLISGNHSNGDGGGVYNHGAATFTNVTFADNMAGVLDGNNNPVVGAWGGGMYVTGSGPVLLNCKFYGNLASNMGGGMANGYMSVATIINSIFDGNASIGGGGGGMMITGPHSSPTVYNSTFVNNHTENGQGGGLFMYGGGPEGRIGVHNSIFWGNTYGDTKELSQIYQDTISDPAAVSVLTAEYNDVQGGYPGAGNISGDPLFYDIDGEDNAPGNEDDDLHLNWASPAIDAGNNTIVPVSVTTDMDGNARLADMPGTPNTGLGTPPIVDMGPYELQPPNLTVQKTVNLTNVAEGANLLYSITLQNTGLGAAHMVSVLDPLPISLELVGEPTIIPADAGQPGVAPVLFDEITVYPGTTVTITYTAKALDGPGTATNVVAVTAGEYPAPGLSATAGTVTITNATPVVAAGPDLTVPEGSTVNFSGSYDDPAGIRDEPYTIQWTFSDNSDHPTVLNPSRAYPLEGNYTATLNVTDADGAQGTDSMVIDVINAAPTVNAGADVTINEGQEYIFHGSYTDPGLGETYTYTWDFDDGTAPVSGTLDPAHTFADNRVYNVKLMVNDGQASTTDTVVVTVNNVAPTAHASSNLYTLNEGSSINVLGSSTDPGSLDTRSYSWNFGDGSTAVTTQNATHTYVDNGLYHVVLTVTDKDGGSDTDTFDVTVDNVTPYNVNPGTNKSGDEASPVSFSGSFVDPGVNDAWTITWDFGDGGTASSSLTPSHTYANSGIYTVTLTVKDKDNAEASGTMTVTVNNVDPVVDAGPDVSIMPGDTVTFNGSYTDPAGTGDAPFVISWDFKDGSTSSGSLTPSHQFLLPGTYHVTLSVTDKDGGVGTDEVIVFVVGYVRYFPMMLGPK